MISRKKIENEAEFGIYIHEMEDGGDYMKPLYFFVENKIFIDTEWNNACEKAKNEKAKYYKVSMYNGGACIKCYKPSIMKLLKERSGLKFEEIG